VQTVPQYAVLRFLAGVGLAGELGAGITLVSEIFGWREIRNGRQLGALVGLVPALYQSGETRRDRGITRAGNQHVSRLMVQLAWG
jgi:transposase